MLCFLNSALDICNSFVVSILWWGGSLPASPISVGRMFLKSSASRDYAGNNIQSSVKFTAADSIYGTRSQSQGPTASVAAELPA